MQFKTESAVELSVLTEYVESSVRQITRRGGCVVDVDFLIDNAKMRPYRAVIKFTGGR